MFINFFIKFYPAAIVNCETIILFCNFVQMWVVGNAQIKDCFANTGLKMFKTGKTGVWGYPFLEF